MFKIADVSSRKGKTPMVDPKIIEKIQKLFNLGDRSRNNSEGEAMNALEAAKRLMAEHNISMAEIAKQTTKAGENKSWNWGRSVAAGASGKKQFLGNFEHVLLNAVSKLTSTQVLIYRQNGGVTAMYYGEEHDVAIAGQLFQILVEASKRCSRAVLGSGWTPSHRQFVEGFALAVYSRSCQALPAPAEAATYALVVQSKETWLQAQMKKHHPDVKTGRKLAWKGKQDPLAYKLGHEDGMKVDLEHKNRLNG